MFQTSTPSLFQRAAIKLTEPVRGAKNLSCILGAGLGVGMGVYVSSDASMYRSMMWGATTASLGYALVKYHYANRSVPSALFRLILCGALVFGGLQKVGDAVYMPFIKKLIAVKVEAVRAEAEKHSWESGKTFSVQAYGGKPSEATVVTTQNWPGKKQGELNHVAFLRVKYSVPDLDTKKDYMLHSLELTDPRSGATPFVNIKQENGVAPAKPNKNVPLYHDVIRGNYRKMKLVSLRVPSV